MSMIAYQQPPEGDQKTVVARATRDILSHYARKNVPLKLRVTDGEDADLLDLPEGSLALLMDILEIMATGQRVAVLPENTEINVAQAAEVLNVVPSFLIEILDEQKIPNRKEGKDYRMRIEDVITYKTSLFAEQENILDQLMAETQKHGLGYN